MAQCRSCDGRCGDAGSPPTPIGTLDRALEIGKKAGLDYVYEGNVPGSAGETTRCPGCRALLIERWGSSVLSNRIEGGHCPDCGRAIAGVRMDRKEA